MKQKIIGFGHHSRVGKDTSAKFLNTILRAQYKINAIHVSFAWKLKEVCFQLFGWAGHKPPIHYENFPEDRTRVLQAIGKTPLQLWIEVGNKLREVYDNVWVDFALQGQPLTADVIIISDVRFPNEINRIYELGGMCFKVTRSGVPLLDSPSDKALDNWTNWTGVLQNEGTQAELHKLVQEMVVPYVTTP